MVKSFKILIFLFSVLLFSCEEQGLIIKCPDCVKEEPLKYTLDIKLDMNNFGAPTEISIYEGNLEDSILFGTYNASGTHITILVPLNKKYTLTASYYVPDYYYTVVDSATPRVRYSKDQCDEPCYFVYDRFVNLKLKGK